jgi:cytochrome c peroxidase
MLAQLRCILPFGWLVALILLLVACHDSIDVQEGDLTNIGYNPVPYVLDVPPGFPALEQPADNLMTVDGIQLGRKLFYDPIFSIDSTVSCSSCHQQKYSFTDALAQSNGVAGKTPRRSMNLINVGFTYHGIFWDGRVPTL